MRKPLFLAFCAVFLLAATARAQNPSKEERKIRALSAKWQKAWNQNDLRTLAGLLSVDADYVTDDGTWLRGRTEFENWRTHLQPRAGQQSTRETNRLVFHFLQPDIAVAHLRWTIIGKTGDRSPLRTGISTWLLVKVRNGWKIRAAQDTLAEREGSPKPPGQ